MILQISMYIQQVTCEVARTSIMLMTRLCSVHIAPDFEAPRTPPPPPPSDAKPKEEQGRYFSSD